MNFSKLSPDRIPLWFLVWQGVKYKTRRPPNCVHCGKKWWEHHGEQRYCQEKTLIANRINQYIETIMSLEKDMEKLKKGEGMLKIDDIVKEVVKVALG